MQEAIYAVAAETDDHEVSTEDVVVRLMEWEDVTEVQARQRVIDAIADVEVGITIADDLSAEIWLDPVTEARIQRRHSFHVEHGRGNDAFQAHFKEEGWHTRCALRSWVHDHDGELPTWHQLVAALADHLCFENSAGVAHIALNALDAGAIYMVNHPTRSQVVRFATTEDTEPEGLES